MFDLKDNYFWRDNHWMDWWFVSSKTKDWPPWRKNKTNDYQLRLVVPGIDKQFLKIELNEGRFKLEYKPEKKEEGNDFCEYEPFLYEWEFTSDYRSIKKEDVTAKYLNGILLITIKTPFKEKTLNSFEVDIE